MNKFIDTLLDVALLLILFIGGSWVYNLINFGNPSETLPHEDLFEDVEKEKEELFNPVDVIESNIRWNQRIGGDLGQEDKWQGGFKNIGQFLT